MSGDDSDEAWIADLLNQHAGDHEIDVDALLARLSAQTGQPFGGTPAGSNPLGDPLGDDPLSGRPLDGNPVDEPVTTRRIPLRGVPAMHARPAPAGDRRRRLAPIALAAAAIVAVSLSAPAVADLSRWRSGAGTSVEVNRPSSVPPTAGAAAPGPPSADPSRPAAGNDPADAPNPRTNIGDSTATSAPPDPKPGTGARFRMPTTPRWRLADPKTGPSALTAGGDAALDDPTIVLHNGTWHVFATAVGLSGTSLVHLSFNDWPRAARAQQHVLDRSGIGGGRRSAPQLFWFAPQRLWYLVHRNGDTPSYSTNPDLDNPSGWTASQPFRPGSAPATGPGTGDWVVCDNSLCHLYSTDGTGRLYRSQTRLADFPRGMSSPVVALQDGAPGQLLGSPSVYRIVGIDRFLLLTGALDQAGRRYVRSWTSSSAAGPWSEFAGSQANPFAGATTASFDRATWVPTVGSGELVRAGTDQTATLDTCHLQYLFGGTITDAPNMGRPAGRLGLLTNENPRC